MMSAFRIFCLAALLLPWTSAARAGALAIDGYAAIVDDRVITVGDVMGFIQPTDAQLRLSYEGKELADKRAEAFRNGLNLLSEQAMILQEFKRQGGDIPDRLVNDRVNEVIFKRFNNDRSEFLRALAEQKMTLDEWKADLRDNLVVEVLRRQEVSDRIRISPRDVIAAYEAQRARFTTPAQVRVRIIMLNRGSSEEDREVKRQQAVLVRGKALAGDDFADLARTYSEGTKAAEGGDWGWIEPGILRAELRAAADKLHPGDISDIIETDGEYYLMKLDDRRPGGVQSFEEVRAQLESELRQTEGKRLYSLWMERLRRNHNVQTFDVSPL